MKRLGCRLKACATHDAVVVVVLCIVTFESSCWTSCAAQAEAEAHQLGTSLSAGVRDLVSKRIASYPQAFPYNSRANHTEITILRSTLVGLNNSASRLSVKTPLTH
jgi:uncharacterized protein (UPF0333 family)